MKNYIESCKVLGVREIVDENQLKNAYRQLIKQCHPDKFVADKNRFERAIEKTKRVNLAYTYLNGLIKRKLVPKSDSLYKRNIRNYSRNYKPGLPDETILEISLKSNHTVSVGYDYEAAIMFIKFANSKVYKFFGISPTIFEEFIMAKSHHKYAHENIFFRFPYVNC